MADPFEEVFNNLRRSAFADDPNSIPQERMANDGQGESVGWLADNSVTSDVIRANAVIAAKISAGAVETDKLAANAVTAAKIAANTITANEIAANAITTSELNAGAVTAAKIAANTITANEIAANTITASEIAADAITTSELAANAVITENLLAANVTSGKIELTISGKDFGANSGSASAPGVFFDANTDTGMWHSSNTVTLGADGSVTNSRLTLGGSLATFGGVSNVSPSANAASDLGSSGVRWDDLWCVTVNASSDARLKTDIADSALGLDFVRSLRPRAYRWRDTKDTQAREAVSIDEKALARECKSLEARIAKARAQQLAGKITDAEAEARVVAARAALDTIRERYTRPLAEATAARRPGKRLHHGLIAQEVKAALDAAGMDAALWREAPDGEQSLLYLELIAPLIRAVQELAAKVDRLESN